jgi:hypothetical protein
MTPEAARTIILYGDSGLGKSSNAFEFAKLAYRRTGKPVRLISAEVSSQIVFQPLIELGIVEPYWFINPRNPLPGLRRLSRGDWPVRDAKGAWSWQPWGQQAGAYILEGLTSISESLLEDSRDKQRMMAEQKDKAFEEMEGGEQFKFAKSSMSNFDFVQTEMLRNLKAFGGLAVWRVLWTAHETKGEDEDTKAAIRGPGLVGKAKTGAVQKYCSVLLHIEGYPEAQAVEGGKLTVTRIKRRLWYEPHPDLNFKTITYPAKVTIPASNLGQLAGRFPGGFFEAKVGPGGLENSLADFIELEERLVGSETAALGKWKDEVDKERAAGEKKEVVGA